jgi:hypothetical protein
MNSVVEILCGMSNGDAVKERILRDAWGKLEPFAAQGMLGNVLRQFGGGTVGEHEVGEVEAALARPAAATHKAMAICACLALAHLHRDTGAGLSRADVVRIAKSPETTFSKIPAARLAEAISYLALVVGQEPEEEDEGSWKSDLLLKVSNMTAIVQRIPGYLEQLQHGIREAMGLPAVAEGNGPSVPASAKVSYPSAEEIAKEVAKEVAKTIAPRLGKDDLEPVAKALDSLQETVNRLQAKEQPCYLPLSVADAAMMAVAMVGAAALSCGATGGNFYGLVIPLIPLALFGYLWAARRWRR